MHLEFEPQLPTDIPERVTDIEYGDRLGGSDHIVIHCKVTTDLPRVNTKKSVLMWSKADFTGMESRLDSVPWDQLFRQRSAEEQWVIFRDHLQAAVNDYVPVKQAGPPGRPPWMSREIAAALRRKRKLWKESQQRGAADEYRLANNKVKKLIRKSKRNFEKKLAEGGQCNRRPFFAYVKRKTKSRPTVGPLMDRDRNKVTGNKEMADLLNTFFCSVFTPDSGQPVPDAVPTVCPGLNDLQVTSDMVEQAIKKLRPTSAAGPDGIGPQLLTRLKRVLSPALATIFNTSLCEGQVPEDWKRANVTPIFKKGSKADPGNYRPVSLTSVCGKLLERIIKDRVVHHLLENDLILPSQHGFMPNKSCVTNLLEFLETVTSAVDDGSPFDIIFLDFAKAFDKVPTAPLLAKLQAMGIGGQLLSWISEWLSNRQQRVVLNGEASTWSDVTSGVPQGSILGPLLFIIYINDIDLVLHLIEVIKKFADDTKLGNRSATAEQREALQLALDQITSWADKWGMQFNVKKCKVMYVGHGNIKQPYVMNGHVLEETSEERDVGVVVSNTLKPGPQCARAARTAAAVLGQITRAFQYRDRHVFIRLYKQYVLPHLEFSVQAWSPWTEADKEVLEKVQERAISMVAGLKGRTYEERLVELNMDSLEERRYKADMTLVFKMIHGFSRVNPGHWFNHVVRSGNVTRGVADPLNFVKARHRLEVRGQFYSQRVVKLWNAIPANLKRAKTPAAFKQGIGQYRKDLVTCA